MQVMPIYTNQQNICGHLGILSLTDTDEQTKRNKICKIV